MISEYEKAAIIITKRSPVSGEDNTRTIYARMSDYYAWKNDNMLVQHAMPYLSAEDREFLISGCTPEDWQKLFGDEE